MMAQCYSVEAVFNFKDDDPSRFCEIVREEVEARNSFRVRFDLTRGSLSDPLGCFRTLTSKYANKYFGGRVWCADFCGTYGWGGVMCEIFEHALSACEDGSYVRILPIEDGYVIRVSVENGIVKLVRTNKDDG